MAVDIKAAVMLEPGNPRKLFSTTLGVSTEPGLDQYAVTADGQRFLVLAPVEATPSPITVVLNWTAGLKK